MAESAYRRFPGKETCEECPARRWYLQGGRRYCENGHQVEGYVEFDIDDADNFGKSGKTTAKKKETKEVARGPLKGNAGRELYLECLQLLLRLQIDWMVKEKGVTPKLEVICKDLWVLRVKGFVGLKKTGTDEDLLEGDEPSQSQGQSRSQSQSSAGTAPVMHSLQRGLKEKETAGAKKRQQSRIQSWTGTDWALPGVVDTLAMVYIACVLLRQSVRVGDIFRWAKRGKLPFLGASSHLPERWIRRLPPWAHKVLLTRSTKFKGGELHTAILNLMVNYREHFELIVPAIQVPTMLQTWLRDMAIPLDVYHYAQKLCRMFELQFQFPTRANRHGQQKIMERYSLLDLPDVLLAASVVLATTFCYPPDNIDRYPRSKKDPTYYKMNWDAWLAEFPRTAEEHRTRVDCQHIQPGEVRSMSTGEIMDYLDWFQATQLSDQPVDPAIDRLFPLKEIKKVRRTEDMTEEEITARWSRVKDQMVVMQVKANDQDVPRLGDSYRWYKEADQLKGVARRIYEVAADVAGLSLKEMFKAVHALEVMMDKLYREERKRRREQGEDIGSSEGDEGSEEDEEDEDDEEEVEGSEGDEGSDGGHSEAQSREYESDEGVDEGEDDEDEGQQSGCQIVDRRGAGELLDSEGEEEL